MGDAGGVPDRNPVASRVGSGVGFCNGCGVCCLHRVGGSASVPLHLQHVSGFFALPLCQRRYPSDWFRRSIAGCLTIAAFSLLCTGHSTPRFFSSWTSARDYLIRYCVSSSATRQHPPLAILAIFNAKHMSDCSSCTWPPCLTTVADMLKTFKKLVAAVNSKLWLVPQPYMHLWPPLRWLKPALSTPVDA